MTKRTADEWQTLLDGVAEGPWEARQDGYDPVWMIGRLGDNPARIVGDGYGEGNARLLAAAPEAVAEVVRLRRALTHWADGLDTLADEMREKGYIMNSEQVKAITAGIRRILEGHNDE